MRHARTAHTHARQGPAARTEALLRSAHARQLQRTLPVKPLLFLANAIGEVIPEHQSVLSRRFQQGRGWQGAVSVGALVSRRRIRAPWPRARGPFAARGARHSETVGGGLKRGAAPSRTWPKVPDAASAVLAGALMAVRRTVRVESWVAPASAAAAPERPHAARVRAAGSRYAQAAPWSWPPHSRLNHRRLAILVCTKSLSRKRGSTCSRSNRLARRLSKEFEVRSISHHMRTCEFFEYRDQVLRVPICYGLYSDSRVYYS